MDNVLEEMKEVFKKQVKASDTDFLRMVRETINQELRERGAI